MRRRWLSIQHGQRRQIAPDARPYELSGPELVPSSTVRGERVPCGDAPDKRTVNLDCNRIVDTSVTHMYKISLQDVLGFRTVTVWCACPHFSGIGAGTHPSLKLPHVVELSGLA